MTEFPPELENTNRLFYLENSDGTSQAPLMRDLTQAAKELYQEYSEFCAIIPFGSRTKGLSNGWKSDLDIFLILKTPSSGNLMDNENFTKTDSIRHALEAKLGTTGIKNHILTKTESDYRQILGALGIPGADVNILGAILGPHRLTEAQKQVRRNSEERKDEILRRLMKALERSENNKKRDSERELPAGFIKNRMRLWEKRISSLLRIKKDTTLSASDRGVSSRE